MAVVDVRLAPFADYTIELSVLSVSSKRYKTYYCVECNHPFLQRDDGSLYRINTNNEPYRMLSDASGMVMTRCGRCSQKYIGYVAYSVNTWVNNDQLLAHTSQSIYLQPMATKEPRYIRCFECGHTFCTLMDRITRIVDNNIPVEYMLVDRIVAIENRCRQQKCRQRWLIMV